MWAREWKDSRLVKDCVIENDKKDTRTHKVFDAIDEVCRQFDLATPIWLENQIEEFQRHAKVRFYQDSFIEQIPFDYLEIQIIEEDGF